MPCVFHAASTLLIMVLPRVPLFPAEANVPSLQARAAEHCAQGALGTRGLCSSGSPFSGNWRIWKGGEQGKARVFVQTDGAINRQIHKPWRKPEKKRGDLKKKKSTKHLSRENRVPGSQRHCQSTLAEALTPRKQQNGSLYQPEKSTQVPASRSHLNPWPTPVVPPEFSGFLVQPGQDQLQIQSLIFKILSELAMLNSAEPFKKEKKNEKGRWGEVR